MRSTPSRSPAAMTPAAAVPSPTKGHGPPTRTERVVPDEEKLPNAKAKAKAKASPSKEIDPLDPTARLSAQLAPPMNVAMPAKVEEVTQRSRVSLEELIPQVVKRVAWGGDRVKGAVHLELVSGDKVTVFAEGRRVRVEVEGNAELEKRIESRLRAAGIEVESVR